MLKDAESIMDMETDCEEKDFEFIQGKQFDENQQFEEDQEMSQWKKAATALGTTAVACGAAKFAATA